MYTRQSSEYSPRSYQLKVEPPRLGDLMQRREAGRRENRAHDWSDLGVARDALAPIIDPIIRLHTFPKDLGESLGEIFVDRVEAGYFRRKNRYQLNDGQGSIIAIADDLTQGELAREIQYATGDHTARLEFAKDGYGKSIFQLQLGTITIYYGLDGDKFHVNAGSNIALQDKLLATLNADFDTLHYPNPFTTAFHVLRNQFSALNEERPSMNTKVSRAVIDFGADIPFAEFYARIEMKGHSPQDEIYRYRLIQH